jgi:hypothetical protein
MKRLLGPAFCVLFLCPWMLGNSECNAFVGSADKGTSQAILYTARQLIDQGNYTGAIAEVALLSATDKLSHDGLVVGATAYAGRCGLNLVTLASAISNQISTKTLMEILLADMKGATNENDCTTAEGLLVQVSAGDITTDDEIFLAFVEFSRIGALLRRLVDANADGIVDGDTICSAGTSGGGAGTDTDAGTLGVSLNRAFKAIQASGIALAPSVTAQYAAACAAGLNCNVTTTNGFTLMEQHALRTLARTKEIGLKTCAAASGSFSDAACFCP